MYVSEGLWWAARGHCPRAEPLPALSFSSTPLCSRGSGPQWGFRSPSGVSTRVVLPCGSVDVAFLQSGAESACVLQSVCLWEAGLELPITCLLLRARTKDTLTMLCLCGFLSDRFRWLFTDFALCAPLSCMLHFLR